MVYRGEDKLRKFISLVSLASSQESKPDYLYGLAIQRARYCELLASRLDAKFESGQAFLTGMFSLLDSLLDRPLEQIVEEISVEESIKLAITKNEGILGEILMLTKAYEQAQWEEVRRYRDSIGLDEIVLSECYDSSVKWTADLLSVKTN